MAIETVRCTNMLAATTAHTSKTFPACMATKAACTLEHDVGFALAWPSRLCDALICSQPPPCIRARHFMRAWPPSLLAPADGLLLGVPGVLAGRRDGHDKAPLPSSFSKGLCVFLSCRAGRTGSPYVSLFMQGHQDWVFQACWLGNRMFGHQDWVFQACWLDDESFVTGGRDGKLMVWRVNLRDPELLTDTCPVFTKDTKLGRCRDIGHAPSLSRLCAVDPDTACIKLYDTRTWRQVDKFSLPESSDAMCVAMRHDVIAVGSASKLSRCDPRMHFLTPCNFCQHDHHMMQLSCVLLLTQLSRCDPRIHFSTQ
ncbi:hypothetical protein DUNSADRAFT_10373, partial [Dunaliella salina]